MMVCELKKYNVNIAGISETKWFDQSIYEVEGYMILHSGRPVPAGSPLERGGQECVLCWIQFCRQHGEKLVRYGRL